MPEGDEGGGGGEVVAGGGEEDEGGDVVVGGGEDDEGGEETEIVGATSCVRPGICVRRPCRPRPAGATLPGDPVDAAPIPEIAPATGVLAEEAVALPDEAALLVPALVRGAVVKADAPMAARPVAAIEVRFSLVVLFVWTGERGCDDGAVVWDVTLSPDGAVIAD